MLQGKGKQGRGGTGKNAEFDGDRAWLISLGPLVGEAGHGEAEIGSFPIPTARICALLES